MEETTAEYNGIERRGSNRDVDEDGRLIDDDVYVNRHRALAIAEQAAQHATIRTLKALGMNVDNQIEVQKDFAYLSRSRIGAENTKKIAKKAGITAALTFIGSVGFYLFQVWFNKDF